MVSSWTNPHSGNRMGHLDDNVILIFNFFSKIFVN